MSETYCPKHPQAIWKTMSGHESWPGFKKACVTHLVHVIHVEDDAIVYRENR